MHALLQSNITVIISIPYGNYQPEQLRKGADDDVNLRISEVISDHGEVDTYRGVATLCIKALCQVLSNICLADWKFEASVLTYYCVPENCISIVFETLI